MAKVVRYKKGTKNKKTVVSKESKRIVITINDEKNDDWMKSLPGYKNETVLPRGK